MHLYAGAPLKRFTNPGPLFLRLILRSWYCTVCWIMVVKHYRCSVRVDKYCVNGCGYASSSLSKRLHGQLAKDEDSPKSALNRGSIMSGGFTLYPMHVIETTPAVGLGNLGEGVQYPLSGL